jgi:branched-chain amino acid transport system permease protein
VAGLALLVGHAGQLSLAQGAFMALGAYAYGILGVRLHWPPALNAPK